MAPPAKFIVPASLLKEKSAVDFLSQFFDNDYENHNESPT
jgi:hypothetical protein